MGAFLSAPLVRGYVPSSAPYNPDHVPDMGIWMGALLEVGSDSGTGSDSKFKTSSFAHLVFDGVPALGEGKLQGFYRADML